MRPLDRVACHPYDDDDECAAWGGGAEQRYDPVHCRRYYETAATHKVDRMLTSLIDVLKAVYVRAAHLSENLRQARERNDVAAYVYPSNNACFALAPFAAVRPNLTSIAL